MPSSSRSTQSKGISGTTSTWCLVPLTVSSNISVCPWVLHQVEDRSRASVGRHIHWSARQHCLVSGRARVFTNPAGSCAIPAESLAAVVSGGIDLAAAQLAILSRSETRGFAEHTREIGLRAEAEFQRNFDQG